MSNNVELTHPNGSYTPGEMLVLNYYNGLNKEPVAVGKNIDKLKTRAGLHALGDWHLNFTNYWVSNVDFNHFYIIEPIEEVK